MEIDSKGSGLLVKPTERSPSGDLIQHLTNPSIMKLLMFLSSSSAIASPHRHFRCPPLEHLLEIPWLPFPLQGREIQPLMVSMRYWQFCRQSVSYLTLRRQPAPVVPCLYWWVVGLVQNSNQVSAGKKRRETGSIQSAVTCIYPFTHSGNSC